MSFGQDTLRRKPVRTVFELGINTTYFIDNLVSLNEASSVSFDPYALQAKLIFNDRDGVRIGVGGNYNRKTGDYQTSLNSWDNLKIIKSSFDLRLGYEHRIVIGPKWQAFTGVDLVVGTSSNDTLFPYTFQINTVSYLVTERQTRIGGGAVFGILFYAGSRVIIGTETSAQLEYAITETEFTSGIATQYQFDSATSLKFNFVMPTSIFINIRFGKQFSRKYGHP